jgi:hypothetical protein
MENLKVHLVLRSSILIILLSVFLSFSCDGRITTRTGDSDISDNDSEYNEEDDLAESDAESEDLTESEEEPEEVDDVDCEEDDDEDVDFEDLCGNGIVEEGEICDGNKIACEEIGPQFAGGFAECKKECNGWRTQDCIFINGDTCYGNYYVREQGDVDKLNGCKHFEGSIFVEGTPVTELTFPELVTVEGDIKIIENLLLETVSMPKLQHIKGDIAFANYFYFSNSSTKQHISNPLLKKIALPEFVSTGGTIRIVATAVKEILFPKLKSIGKNIEIGGNELLETVSFPMLENIKGNLELIIYPLGGGYSWVWGNDVLLKINFSKLLIVGGSIEIRDANELTAISFPKLVSCQSFMAHDNLKVTEIKMPELKTVTGYGKYGSLSISNNPDLQELQLDNLEESSREINISYNHALEALSLNSLISAGSFSLRFNNALLEIKAVNLENVKSITLQKNNLLKSVTFTGVEVVGGSLIIKENESFEDLIMPALYKIVDNLEFSKNNSLKKINFAGVTEIRWGILINGNDMLETADFPDLNKLGWSLTVENTRVLKSVTLPGVEVVEDSVTIRNNESSATLIMPALNKIKGSLAFSNNNSMENIYFAGITEVGQDILINGNDMLETVDFPDLNKMGRNLTVENTPVLKSVTIPGVEVVEGSIAIRNNESFTDLIMPELYKISGSLEFRNNNSMENIYFAGIREVGQDILINGNAMLETIDFPDLNKMGRNLAIESTEFLKELSMPFLYSVGSNFIIRQNLSLEDFDFTMMSRVGKDLSITGNPEFPAVIAEELHYQIKYREGIGGKVLIEGNKE